MLALLEFAFDRSAVESWVYTEWAKIYDERFIEESVLKPIENLRQDCDTLLNSVSRKATGTDAKADQSLTPAEPKLKHTIPSPFQLTEPKPRELPVPRETIKPVTHKPIPKSLNENSLQKIKEQDEARLLMMKERTLSKYADEAAVPTLATASRAADIDSLRKEIDNERLAECTFQPNPAKPVPKILPEAEVKATSASLLRSAVVDVADKIAEKKRQRLAEERKLQEELRKITDKRAALAESAELLARKRHEELHKGRKREASHRQKTVLNEKSREMKVSAQSKAIRETNAAKVQTEMDELRKRYRWEDEFITRRYLLVVANASRMINPFQ
ncbi:Protein anoxia up-regulated, putative [Perkinsus marinus ATCC 50983]|uniref:Protein anoxia up-regulated, putative n=1 Tax=Perkinsus marinus (strain ATCC 50983 / TXsc) TaxID=423536 RepID=C5K9Y2_PERM5|nr:Protein anoxia up-regulated, putative [Perkinsus marinus ATCC 50983]EER18711.1 Protein anoxia up-regulated, putative [Perkinsus marinus ATCC 50983]|eukprot:XP_002786915.1 Protein anoxia up-regulated, putative [Perkinsus marinus ATCC 50983]